MTIPANYIIATNTVGKDGNGVPQVKVTPDQLKSILNESKLLTKKDVENRYNVKVWEVPA